ncbi:hypothetical protein L195_g002410 [Trifolium pratense]|uniref:Uncharacterized protein n=1 Tax=Trifolium pratense TaxID=57577 RepID=A0A2K3NSE1_TRIPR|nr:hypothetical protein L195_g002410 [Trifolium pratense]
MRDQETDREGNGLSIIGGPSLELNRSRSSPLSCLGSGIPSLVGGFSSKVIKCGAGSSLSTSSECVGEARPGKDGLDREAMPTLLVTTKRRSQERKEGLEPSTSALARLCSTIKLFPPATAARGGGAAAFSINLRPLSAAIGASCKEGVLVSSRAGASFHSRNGNRTLRPSPERPAYPACAFGAPHSFNHLLVIAAIPGKRERRGNRPLPFM